MPESNQCVVNTKNKRPIEPVSESQQVPSKKKRKKDKNAGLLYSLKTNEKTSEKKIVNLCQQTQTLNIQKKTNALNQPNKHLKKNSNKNKANTPNNKVKNKIMLTPKRNNLVLLANALKATSNQSSSSQTDKLKQMLR